MSGQPRAWRKLRQDRSGMAGLLIVGVFLLAAAGVWFGAWGQDWAAADGGRWQAPGSEYWFGTNVLGQDIFERALYSVRTAFEIGLVVAMLATALGAVLGAAAGWYSETWVDGGIMWLKGVLDSIPFYLFVAAVAYALQGQPWAMHLAMVATFWTTTARLVRAVGQGASWLILLMVLAVKALTHIWRSKLCATTAAAAAMKARSQEIARSLPSTIGPKEPPMLTIA